MNEPFVSEGLVEFLQAMAPQWATKLTKERMSFVRLLAAKQSREDAIIKTATQLELLQIEVRQYLDKPGCNQGSRATAVRRLEWALKESKES